VVGALVAQLEEFLLAEVAAGQRGRQALQLVPRDPLDRLLLQANVVAVVPAGGGQEVEVERNVEYALGEAILLPGVRDDTDAAALPLLLTA
jgi:hypothetical protein